MVDFLCSQAGIVHFPNGPVLLRCDIQVMMLVFSQKREQFMGLIPKEQQRFIASIKQAFKKPEVVLFLYFIDNILRDALYVMFRYEN